jgi:hypothetical protein
MTESLILAKPAPAWFYALIEWIQNLNYRRKISSEENYFLID